MVNFAKVFKNTISKFLLSYPKCCTLHFPQILRARDSSVGGLIDTDIITHLCYFITPLLADILPTVSTKVVAQFLQSPISYRCSFR